MLQFDKISKSFDGVEVLHDVSFSLPAGKIVALVGENGAGKSTLMKILSGILPDYQGRILLNDREIHPRNPRAAERLGITMIHQELNLVSDLTAGENIFLGKEPASRWGRLDFRKLYQMADQALQEFDFPYAARTRVRSLPVGWQQMVEIARALQANASLLIMDEPTSALSEHEINLLFQKMRLLRERGKTIIFISHRLREIFAVADEIVVLRDGNFVGKFDRPELTREKLITLMIGHDLTVPEKTDIQFSDGRDILRLNNLQIRRQKNSFLSNIHFSLKKGEVLGIAGLLGSGRTELLKFLYGELPVDFSGEIYHHGVPWIPESASKSINQRVVFLPEDRKREGIFPEHHLLFNSSISMIPQLSRHGFVLEERERKMVSDKFDKLNVRCRSMSQKIPTLSGGNQQKVLLSRILLLEPELLLLDEPTRGIDVGAKEEIYLLIESLSERGTAVIVTSSEIPELLRMCHRVLVLAQGRQTALLETHQTTPQEILTYAFKQDEP